MGHAVWSVAVGDEPLWRGFATGHEVVLARGKGQRSAMPLSGGLLMTSTPDARRFTTVTYHDDQV